MPAGGLPDAIAPAVSGDQRHVVAEKSFNEYSGIYQWQALHRAITEGESISDGYIQRVVEGIKVLEAMRGTVVPA